MKLMKREEYEKAIDALISEINETQKDYTLGVSRNFKKEESTGSIFFVFSFKKEEKKKSAESKIGLYIFESRKSICTFIVNGRTMDMLFENSTINSPDIALHYLKDILLNEVEWIREFDKKMDEYAEKKKKNFHTRKSGGYNNGKDKKPYAKKSYSYPPRKDGQSSNDTRRSDYHGKRNTSGYNGHNRKSSTSSYQIKTSKNPYQK